MNILIRKIRFCLPKFLFIFMALQFSLFAQETQQDSTWEIFRFFIDSWDGYETGRTGFGKGGREYKLILNDKYLYFANTSIFKPQEKNPRGEIHEDWTIFSYDNIRKKYIVRQLNSEGYINKFVLDSISTDTTTFIFLTEEMENVPDGYRARLTYIIQNEDEFTEKFELAPPNKDYQLFLHNFWKRTDTGKSVGE